MICPRCDAKQTGDDAVGKRTIINSRNAGDDAIRRRYQCWSCGHRWTTYEVIELVDEFKELEGLKVLSI